MTTTDIEPAAAQPTHPRTAASAAAEPVEVIGGLHTADIVRFIPVSRSDVLAHLLAPDFWFGHNLQAIDDTIHYLGRLRQQDSAIKLDELMDSYHPFNPDNDIEFATPISEEEKAELREKFVSGVGQLVFRGNFEHISRPELERVLAETSPYGVEVDVDLDEFEPLLPYFRGVKVRDRSRPDWRWGYLRKRHYKIHTYERLFLALTLKSKAKRVAELMAKDGLTEKAAEKKFNRLRRAIPGWVNADQLYLKMFKDVPQVDLEMLLPNNGIKFRAFDRFMLWASGGGTTAYALVVAILKLVLAVAISPLIMFMTLFGFGGTAFRQVMNVLNTRTRYMAELVQKLYFHNISNNQGALTLLIDEAEEEDIKEDSLLYAFLLRQHSPFIDIERAKTEIEAFLQREFNISVSFDHEEAFGRLEKRGLAGRDARNAIWVLPPTDAVPHLRRLWIGALDLRAGSETLLDA